MDNTELLEALISAVETLEWINGCSSPNRDGIEEAIKEAREIIAKHQGS